MKRIVAIVLLLVVGVVLYARFHRSEPKSTFADREIITLTIGDATLKRVEIVNTPASIQQGLSGRDTLGADGMLFILDKEEIPTFWMKEMKFALDFVWIRDNRVADITEHVPAPAVGTALTELKLYHPNQAVHMVLELPAGAIQQQTIHVGDTVIFH
jgi:uncharacterized membrane protein (UPF0127 family)